MLVAMAALAMIAAEPALAKPEYIRLDPGKIMTITEDGKFTVAPAPELTRGEHAKIREVKRMGSEALGPNSVTTVVPEGSMAIIPGEASFLLTHAGNDTALLVRNGLARSLRYKLVIQTERGLEPTDVCEVFAPAHATEHWPYRIEWVAIGEIGQFDRKDQAKPVCK